MIPPTINLDDPDNEYNLRLSAHTAKEERLRISMNNSFGFGGTNASLYLEDIKVY